MLPGRDHILPFRVYVVLGGDLEEDALSPSCDRDRLRSGDELADSCYNLPEIQLPLNHLEIQNTNPLPILQ